MSTKLKKINISEIKPYENNPRINTDEAVEAVCNSIKTTGERDPIEIDENNIILSGHTRYIAYKRMGIEDVDVIQYDDMTDAQKRSYRISANSTNEKSKWDIDRLKVELEALEIDLNEQEIPLDNLELMIGFEDLSDLTGFTESKIQTRKEIEGEDDAPETHETDIKRGDLFILGGKHRILCGDSTDAADIARLMDGARADVVFTDPPYGMHLNTDFYHGFGGPERQDERKINARSKNYPKVTGDDKDYDPAHIFRDFGDAREIFLWGADYYAERLVNKNKGSWFVWDKRAGIEHVEFSLSEFELCWSKRKHHRKILRYTWFGLHGLQFEKDERNGSSPTKRVHPNQKPVRMLDWFVNKYTKENDIVWDGFLGSGSTLIACDKNERVCYGLEIEPEYCQVVIDRWKKLTQSDDVRKLN